MSSLSSLVVVTGPTASGKTSLSIAIAKKFNLEIINADSVQVYQDFNIGAAKPSVNELSEVKHHLISFVSPEASYDAASFLADAKIEIAKLKNPLIAGGSGLYIRSLLHGLVMTEKISSEAIEILEKKENELGSVDLSKNLHSWLTQIDPHTASGLKTNDIQRIKRAILVKLSTEKSLSELQEKHRHQTLNYRTLVICLLPDREILYQRINQRVQEMLSAGLEDEVKSLMQKYDLRSKPFKSIGYKQMISHLQGSLSYQEMVESIQQETRNFAKRQYTWWKNQPANLSWQMVSLNSAGNTQGNQLLPKEAIFDSISAFLSRDTTYNVDKVWFLPVNFAGELCVCAN